MKYRRCPLLVVVCGFLLLGIAHGSEDLLNVTHTVIFDVQINAKPAGKIIIGLFGQVVPRTVDNFIQLAIRPKGLGYIGTKFNRIVKGATIQGGNIGPGENDVSIYGGYFPDENFKVKHYGAGWVAMANDGVDTNACQFYITTQKQEFIEGKCVVFGKVLKGMNVVRQIENLRTNDEFTALEDAEIYGSSVIVAREPFKVSKNSAQK